MSNDPTTRSAVLDAVLRRAAVEPAFRQRLLADATAAVNEMNPSAVPHGVRLRFIERPAELDALYVLPDQIQSSPELTVQELEAVAGGAAEELAGCPWTCIDLVTCIVDTVSV
jgi:hypothetical protein